MIIHVIVGIELNIDFIIFDSIVLGVIGIATIYINYSYRHTIEDNPEKVSGIYRADSTELKERENKMDSDRSFED
ncbi:MAG: hypothetical protein ACOC44_20370 [Promethearchaeia archaeon]